MNSMGEILESIASLAGGLIVGAGVAIVYTKLSTRNLTHTDEDKPLDRYEQLAWQTVMEQFRRGN